MRHHYCCYFDERYLSRGLVMIRSLKAVESGATIWILCLTDACHAAMTEIAEPDVRLIRFSEFEAGDEALAQARQNRNLIEYYFTCTPSLILYVMARVKTDDVVTYVDGDLFFFSSTAPLYEPLKAASVTLVEHRFPDRLRKLEAFGRFNVGWLSFRNDEAARAIATWWRDQCNEWCYDRLDGDRFADQAYLNKFEALFPGVAVIHHPGANLAPWNLARHRLEQRDGRLFVDGDPLIFFHFHGLKQHRRDRFSVSHQPYRAPFHGLVRRALYKPYVEALLAVEASVRLEAPPSGALTRDDSQRSNSARLKASLIRLWRTGQLHFYRHILTVRDGKVR